MCVGGNFPSRLCRFFPDMRSGDPGSAGSVFGSRIFPVCRVPSAVFGLGKSIQKTWDKTPICFLRLWNNLCNQIRNEAHVVDVSVKLHSSVARQIFQIFRKQGTKLTLFICGAGAVVSVCGTGENLFLQFRYFFIGKRFRGLFKGEVNNNLSDSARWCRANFSIFPAFFTRPS